MTKYYGSADWIEAPRRVVALNDSIERMVIAECIDCGETFEAVALFSQHLDIETGQVTPDSWLYEQCCEPCVMLAYEYQLGL